MVGQNGRCTRCIGKRYPFTLGLFYDVMLFIRKLNYTSHYDVITNRSFPVRLRYIARLTFKRKIIKIYRSIYKRSLLERSLDEKWFKKEYNYGQDRTPRWSRYTALPVRSAEWYYLRWYHWCFFDYEYSYTSNGPLFQTGGKQYRIWCDVAIGAHYLFCRIFCLYTF